MPYTRDAEGKLVWVDETPVNAPVPSDGSTLAPEIENQLGGEPKVQLINEATGDVVDVGQSGAATAIETGRFRMATPDEVERWDTRAEREGALATLKTGLETGVAGAFDAVTGIPRLATAGLEAAGAIDQDPFAGVSGRQFLSNLMSIGGDHDYDERARQRALDNPVAAFLGGTTGALLGGGGATKLAGSLGGATARATGSRLAGTAVAGTLEGAALSVQQTGEQAFVEDSELTAEQMLAGMGWGALIGGGVGLGVGGARALFGRAGSRGSTPLDSPRLDAPDAALEATAARALGDVPPVPGLAGKLRDALEDAQAAVAGADRGALGEVSATRGFLDPKSSAYKKRSLWWNRDAIRENATAKLTDSLEQAAADADDVLDNVVDAGLKRSHIAPKLTADKEVMVQTARAEVQRVREELGTALARADEFGNKRLLLRQAKYLDSIAPTSDDAADSFIALDRLKRGLQKDVKALRTSSGRSGNALEQMQSRQLADYLEASQERIRTGLEDAAIWGEAGTAQKAINGRWGEFLRTQQTFREAFLRRVEGSDYLTGRPVYRVDPDKVASYIRKTGRQEGKLVDEYFRRHVDAREALAREIGDAFETGGDEVARLTSSSKSIRQTLGELDETARAVNQVEAVMEAEGTSGMAGTAAVVGGVIGGAPGAAIGGLLGAAARPGTMIRQAAAIEQLARNVNLKLERGIGDFFERAASPIRALLPQAAKAGAARSLKPIPTVTALELFRGKEADNQKAYKKRVTELLASTENFGAGIRARSEEALGELPAKAPKLSQAMVTTATRGAEFLKSKIPAPIVDSKSLTPKTTPPIVSDFEIAQFARYWSAVSNPLSVLDDLRRGTVAPEQVEALQAVYPKLYQSIQTGVREKLLELDEAGIIVPYQARLQLDLLLNLNGAGEVTASVEFMLRYQQAAATVPNGGKPQRQPPPQPVNLSANTAAGSSRFYSATEEST